MHEFALSHQVKDLYLLRNWEVVRPRLYVRELLHLGYPQFEQVRLIRLKVFYLHLRQLT